mmetsp:Transcript_2766/g.3914  ORF Transcript_2766/g.3914 Transcript_2766/m.3914 type:complete len:283 (-) Transcript_2766:234-1082(-)|eukprot:CAMPEP_0194078858 /NCGR_PEP_ID=MMETSP0149-20130528/5160_1 /TAXON_ID=122233 /ORGANISM="Chaetoceros debilis, Strain MM31A-1" /LENGTH=282 /DNA_ID=CAMNT_0038760189 /DNA_START=75 /DNA_END=923 /DNA_ORIENTATION=-
MGNLIPCCGSEEGQKESALSMLPHAANSNGANGNNTLGVSPDRLHHNHNHNHNLNLNHNGGIHNNSSASSPPPLSSSNNNNNNNNNSANNPNNAFQIEERQRALHQEHERLERIVNDAGQDMVHVNHGHGAGMRTSSGINGYYDAGYASEMWQDLIPGRSGGLIQRCEDIDAATALSLKKLPKSMNDGNGNGNMDVLDILSQSVIGNGNSNVWNDDVIKCLEEFVSAGGASSASSMSMGNMSMGNGGLEMVLDDLAERFLAGVFQKEGFQTVGVGPIVENVL